MTPEVERLFRDLSSRVAAMPLLAGLNLPALSRPAVRLSARKSSGGLGASRIGGTPDVPPGFEWPRWNQPARGVSKYLTFLGGPKSVPLGFIAQIDLSAMPRVSDTLPDSGWLYFFYDRTCEPWGFDPADRGSCRVLYAQCDREQLSPISAPADLKPAYTAKRLEIDGEAFLSLPSDLAGVEYGTPADEAYQQLRDSLGQGMRKSHQLLGHPGLVQNSMELECQLVSHGIYCGDSNCYTSAQAQALKPGAADWRLLLQIDTDPDGPGWMWGDLGRIYFWIREQDLRARRFENVWLILQCF